MDKNKPYDFPELFRDFTLMPKFSDDIDRLAQMAETEDWDYKHTASSHAHPILRNYINYTYRRVAEEKKINVTPDEENCCWNTGLITATQEPIFVLLSKNKLPESQPYWHFWKFARKGERELNRFASLPEMAHRGGSGNSDSVISGSLASPTPRRGGRRKERGDETNTTESRGDV